MWKKNTPANPVLRCLRSRLSMSDAMAHKELTETHSRHKRAIGRWLFSLQITPWGRNPVSQRCARPQSHHPTTEQRKPDTAQKSRASGAGTLQRVCISGYYKNILTLLPVSAVIFEIVGFEMKPKSQHLLNLFHCFALLGPSSSSLSANQE